MVYVKIHKNVIAMCDEELVGKKLEDKKRQIEVYERFYKGEKVSDERALEILKEGKNINLVGNKIVGLALKNGIISKESIIEIKRVKHVQIYFLG